MPTVESPADALNAAVVPISLELVRAARATSFDSAAIEQSLQVLADTEHRLRDLMDDPLSPAHEEFAWERNPTLAECSSLIEGAGALLALAYAPITRENLRGLFVRRAYWVLRVASARTQELLAQGDR